MPIPVAARSLASVCCRSFAGISGSNSVGDMDVCFLSKPFFVMLRPLRQADPCSKESFRMWCVCMWFRSLNNEAVVPRGEGFISATNSSVLDCEVKVCVGWWWFCYMSWKGEKWSSIVRSLKLEIGNWRDMEQYIHYAVSRKMTFIYIFWNCSETEKWKKTFLNSK
jgi:hypothetical protein